MTDGISEGSSYSFRVRAINYWGSGAYSPTKVIVASREPATAITPTTSINTVTGGLIISWSAPANRGSAIDRYLIEIKDKAGTQWASSSECDGSNLVIVAQRTCQIQMTTLTSSPFSYVYDDLIVVRIYAFNVKG